MEKLKAGKYFIGDPCYVLANEEWEVFCEKSFQGNPRFEMRGETLYATGTHHGDGVYFAEVLPGVEFSVDSGTIGVIPEALWGKTESEIQESELGYIYTFDKDFFCDEEEGKISIGHITIDTDPYDDEDEDDYFDEETDWDEDEE